MEKYFKTYEGAADYVAYDVLKEREKKVIQIEKLQMNNQEYFYKLTVEPYEEKVDPYPWAVTSPAIIPALNPNGPNGQPQVWYDTLYGKPQGPEGYKITCGSDGYKITSGQGSSSAMGDTTPLGHNPYQE